MKALEYRFLTHELYTQKYIETKLTAYLIDNLADIPTGETIHYFQRPFATGFYCLILPIKPKRGFIAPVGFSSDGINELESQLKSNKCLNEPTTGGEPLTPEQRRIITEAAGGETILDIKTHIEEIRQNYKPADIESLQWPEIFAIIREHREAELTEKINLLEQKAVADATKSAADAMAQAKPAAQVKPAKTEPKKPRGRQLGSITPKCRERRIEVYLFVSGRGGRPTGKKNCLYTWASLAAELRPKYKHLSADTIQDDFDIVLNNLDVYFPNSIPKQPEIK
jgi:hypothetical protein